MFEDTPEPPDQVPFDPVLRAREKSDEFRMHAERCAVFEGLHKFDARLRPLDSDMARDVQQSIGRLEKRKTPDSPILPPDASASAMALLSLCDSPDLSDNDYHVHRRPGEVMILRFLRGAQVEAFYQRLQAHFDAALDSFREEERSGHGWKQQESTQAYLEALDAIEVNMADRYLRPVILAHRVFVLSTQTADELDIEYLTRQLMRIEPQELVGRVNAPPEDAPDDQRAWFFKLFSLRGLLDKQERMCFFTYLQKSDDF
ncbi:MAG: hypothetical protein NZ561_05250 [Phycisphaerae bacterium]|nr:hypothetical protein [Phycisphaerae bacterium]